MEETIVTLASRSSRAWWSRAGFWIVIIGIAAVVVIEGYALSWGGTNPRPPKSSWTTVDTLASQPIARNCSGGISYMEVDYVRYALGYQPATIAGHEAKWQCGGADDGHYNVLSTVRTIPLSPKVKIDLLKYNPSPVWYQGSLQQLNDYLAIDINRTFFLVVGPPTGATALQAMYVP